MVGRLAALPFVGVEADGTAGVDDWDSFKSETC